MAAMRTGSNETYGLHTNHTVSYNQRVEAIIYESIADNATGSDTNRVSNSEQTAGDCSYYSTSLLETPREGTQIHANMAYGIITSTAIHRISNSEQTRGPPYYSASSSTSTETPREGTRLHANVATTDRVMMSPNQAYGVCIKEYEHIHHI